MASAVIGIQLVTREAVGSGTTWKESSSELSVTLKIHLEVGKTIDRSACAVSKRDSSSSALPVEGEEIRGAICHPPIVCLSSTAILIPKRTNFVILGRFYFPPEADCGDAPRRQFPNSYLTKSPFLRKLRYPSNTVRDERTWTSESLRNVLHAREIEDIRFSIATLVRLVLFLPPSLLTPLFPLE